MGDGNSSTPSFVSIHERYCLNHPASDKQTFHLVLKFLEPPFAYEVGDCIGVYPVNDPGEVASVISYFSNPETSVVSREGETNPFRVFVEARGNLGKISLKFCELALNKGFNLPITSQLHALFNSKPELKKFLEETTVSTFLSYFPKDSFEPQEVCGVITPLTPRYYSIASSQKATGGDIHLTVALSKTTSNQKEFFGVCSNYLCQLASLKTDKIFIFHHPAKDFKLSPETKGRPIIMIGPGTGIAPFRGFMQQRLLENEKENWLFFGERRQEHDFYYKDFWDELVQKGHLRLTTAFSRDQSHKVYVQHKIEAFSKEVWEWISSGAFIFVCGDANQMAKEVDQALLKVIEREGNYSETEARSCLKDLRIQKRYLKDVY